MFGKRVSVFALYQNKEAALGLMAKATKDPLSFDEASSVVLSLAKLRLIDINSRTRTAYWPLLMFYNSVGTNLPATIVLINHHLCWGGSIVQRGFLHNLSHGVAVRQVSQGNNFFSGKFTTRKPWVPVNWCLSIAIFRRASPNQSISWCSSSLPIQGVFTSLFWKIYRQRE